MNEALAAINEDRPRLSAQVRLMTTAVEAHPDAPVNYLLRGEEWLSLGRVDKAKADFETARALAEREAEDSAWGYVVQAYIDRADAGLRQCVGVWD